MGQRKRLMEQRLKRFVVLHRIPTSSNSLRSHTYQNKHSSQTCHFRLQILSSAALRIFLFAEMVNALWRKLVDIHSQAWSSVQDFSELVVIIHLIIVYKARPSFPSHSWPAGTDGLHHAVMGCFCSLWGKGCRRLKYPKWLSTHQKGKLGG